MRDAKSIRYFQRAVLLTLAMPACGGATLATSGAEDGGNGEGGGGSSGGSSTGGGTSGSSSGGGSSGGSSSGSSSSSGGLPTDAASAPDVKLPPTPCNWSVSYSFSCNWSLNFTGDPMFCVGFTGSGTAAQCLAACGVSASGQAPNNCSEYADPDGGASTLNCTAFGTPGCFVGNGGRRPGYFAALGFGPPAAGRELGTHFARAAFMEAGSVDAFRTMRDELIAHRAPRRLVQAASRAMRDEIRHVRQTSALARRFGEKPLAPPAPPPRRVRSLEEMAIENAVEGCVRETYSALECMWQAETAGDPVVRATMTRIARDEMRHLALAWSVHAWVKSRLSPEARDCLLAAQREAVVDLVGEVRQDPHASLVSRGGLPRGLQSQVLISAIEARLAA